MTKDKRATALEERYDVARDARAGGWTWKERSFETQARSIPSEPSISLALDAVSGHTWCMAKPAIDLSTLTPWDKLELIDELWVSLGPDAFELTQEQRQELDRRLDRLDHDAPSGTSWASVRKQVAKASR